MVLFLKPVFKHISLICRNMDIFVLTLYFVIMSLVLRMFLQTFSFCSRWACWNFNLFQRPFLNTNPFWILSSFPYQMRFLPPLNTQIILSSRVTCLFSLMLWWIRHFTYSSSIIWGLLWCFFSLWDIAKFPNLFKPLVSFLL